MTQQQKQRERPKQAPRNVGEIVIATLDLLLGLSLIVFLVGALRTPPRDLPGWLMAGSFILIALGLAPSGLLLWMRQRRLAQAFQWLAALGALWLALAYAYNFLLYPPPYMERTVLLLLSGGILLAALGLILLPFWLRKMEEDE